MFYVLTVFFSSRFSSLCLLAHLVVFLIGYWTSCINKLCRRYTPCLPPENVHLFPTGREGGADRPVQQRELSLGWFTAFSGYLFLEGSPPADPYVSRVGSWEPPTQGPSPFSMDSLQGILLCLSQGFEAQIFVLHTGWLHPDNCHWLCAQAPLVSRLSLMRISLPQHVHARTMPQFPASNQAPQKTPRRPSSASQMANPLLLPLQPPGTCTQIALNLVQLFH